MMPRFFPIVSALSWALMFSAQTVIGAVSPGVEDLPVAVNRAAQTPRAMGESLGLGDIDFPVSLRSFTLDLLAAQPPSWPEARSAAEGNSTSSRKPTPAPMSIAMWFGVLGATLLILPRFRRR
jgi:hypothetical protein